MGVPIGRRREGRLGEPDDGDASIVNQGIVRWFDVFVFSRTRGVPLNTSIAGG